LSLRIPENGVGVDPVTDAGAAFAIIANGALLLYPFALREEYCHSL